jgi:hypothetical protein
MKKGFRLMASIILALLMSLAGCGQSLKSIWPSKQVSPPPVTTAGIMVPADEARLGTIIAQHQRIQSQLPAEYQQILTRLTTQVRSQIFAKLSEGNLLASTMVIVNDIIPSLSPTEATSLSEYILGNIASTTTSDAALYSVDKTTQEMQMSFNLQYLQLQSQMQSENRQFTLVSNIMKTKHDTVENSINNIR